MVPSSSEPLMPVDDVEAGARLWPQRQAACRGAMLLGGVLVLATVGVLVATSPAPLGVGSTGEDGGTSFAMEAQDAFNRPSTNASTDLIAMGALNASSLASSGTSCGPEDGHATGILVVILPVIFMGPCLLMSTFATVCQMIDFECRTIIGTFILFVTGLVALQMPDTTCSVLTAILEQLAVCTVGFLSALVIWAQMQA